MKQLYQVWKICLTREVENETTQPLSSFYKTIQTLQGTIHQTTKV